MSSNSLEHVHACVSSVIPSFIYGLSILPMDAVPRDIDRLLSPALHYESFLRKHMDLNNSYAGLLNVFDTPSRCRNLRIRSEQDSTGYMFALPPSSTPRSDVPLSSCVDDIDTFRANFSLFTHGVLKEFKDWDNVLIAGGSVLAALRQNHTVPTDANSLARLFHSDPYEFADIDVFLWGLTPLEAEAKIKTIFAAVKASVPWDVVAIRKANTISIHTQYPHRPLQIILRLYRSPTEILVGFDIDCCCVCYNGTDVWATPRALASIIMKRLTVDMSRRSPSYELRLAKYARRGFEIYYPKLRRGNIDAHWYKEDLPALPVGLPRLLVLEHHIAYPTHYDFIIFPNKPPRLLATALMPVDEDADHTSRYERAAFQIPYGVDWDAANVKEFSRRIERCLSLTLCNTSTHLHDHLSCTGQHLHRHIMRAYDDISECFDNPCSTCPPPRTPVEALQQERDDAKYIRGPLRFMTQNVSQQGVSGSFNPINDGEWETGTYYPAA